MSCLERCAQFKIVLIERFQDRVCYTYILTDVFLPAGVDWEISPAHLHHPSEGNGMRAALEKLWQYSPQYLVGGHHITGTVSHQTLGSVNNNNNNNNKQKHKQICL